MKTQPTELERKETRRIKMELREAKNILLLAQLPTKPHIFANISKNHEFYGDTPKEHEQRKREKSS
jgi:hypothetical protein